MENPYTILGVAPNASKDEITKEFRKQARVYHPDKNKEDGAGEKIAVMKDAYDYLMDDEKRAFFDRTGRRSGAPGAGEEQFPHGFPFPMPGFSFHTRGPIPPEQLLEMRRKKLHIQVNIELTLEQIYSGISRQIHYQRVRIQKGNQQQESCSCLLTIPPGIHSQSQIEIKDQGHVSMDESEPLCGSLIVVISQSRHPQYIRDAHHPEHLICEREISLAEALCGVSMELTHISGAKIGFNYENVIRQDKTYALHNQGLPVLHRPNTYGDILLRFTIVYPDTLTFEQREGIASLFQYAPAPFSSDAVCACTLIPTEELKEPDGQGPHEQVQCAQS